MDLVLRYKKDEKERINMYTWRHLLWIVISISIVSAIVYDYKRKHPDLDRVFTTALIIAILSEIAKISGVIELVPSHDHKLLLPYIPLNHLPLHFCSIQIVLIAIAKFMKNEKRRETLLAFMAPTCVLGGIRALLMPSIFTTTISVKQAFTNPVSYQFFIFHSMIIALGLVITISGQVDWSMKHFRDTLLFVYLAGAVSIYLNSVFASPTYEDGKLVSVDFWTNFFFTYQNPVGIQITQLWQWYLYLLILMLLSALLLFLFYLPLVKRKQK